MISNVPGRARLFIFGYLCKNYAAVNRGLYWLELLLKDYS